MKLKKTKYYYYYKSSLGKIIIKINNFENFQKYVDTHNGRAPKILKETIKINRNIFKNIENIKSIYLPSSMKNIDVKCFEKFIGIKINYNNVYEMILKNMSPEGNYEKSLRIDKIYSKQKFIDILKRKNGIIDNIPNGVSFIGEYVFKNIIEIKKVFLPDSLTAIYKQAFMNTNIEYIELSKNMIYFGDEAFKNCKKLKEIKINKTMRYIKSNVFSGCSKNLKIIIYNNVTYPKEFNLSNELVNRFNLNEKNISSKSKSLRTNDNLYTILDNNIIIINKKELTKNNNKNEISNIFSDNLGIKLAIYKKYNIDIPNYNIIKIVSSKNILKLKDKVIYNSFKQNSINRIKLFITIGIFSNPKYGNCYNKIMSILMDNLKTNENIEHFLEELFSLVKCDYYYNKKFVSIFLMNKNVFKKLLEKYYINKKFISKLFFNFHNNNYKKLLNAWKNSKIKEKFIDWLFINGDININLCELSLNKEEYNLINNFSEYYNSKYDYERLINLYRHSLKVLPYAYLLNDRKKLLINVSRTNSPQIMRRMNICLKDNEALNIIVNNQKYYAYYNNNFFAKIVEKSDINNALSNCIMNTCVRLHANGCEYLFESFLEDSCQPFLIYDINSNNYFDIVGGFRLDICREKGIGVINSLEILPKAKNSYSTKIICEFIDAFNNILNNYIILYNKYNKIRIKKITLGQAGHCGISKELEIFYKKIRNNNYEFKERKTVSPNRNNHFVIYEGE